MSEEISLVIHSSDINKRKISWNKDEVKAWVSQIIEKYNGLIFSEAQIKEAKEERAKLNKLKKAISDKRIDVKNDFMAPYLNFEKEVKEVIDLIEVPIEAIDSQVKAYEDKQKEVKKRDLIKFFDDNIKELSEYVQFQDIFEAKYLNISMPIKKAEEDILKKINGVREDIHLIEGAVGQDYRAIALEYYKEKKNVTMAVGEVNRLKRIKESERKKQQEVEQKTLIEQDPNEVKPKKDIRDKSELIQENENIRTPDISNDKVIDPFTKEDVGKIYRAHFTCYGTKEQLLNLKQYIIDSGIKFEK